MSVDKLITDRPRRSAMYTPGANERALEKGRDVPADILIMDLEDGVAPDAKDAARENILRVLGEGGYGRREIGVRINGAGSEWHEQDVASISASGANRLANTGNKR